MKQVMKHAHGDGFLVVGPWLLFIIITAYAWHHVGATAAVDAERACFFSLSSVGFGPSKLHGFGLTFSQLQALRDGTLIAHTHQHMHEIQKKIPLTSKDQHEFTTLQKKLDLLIAAHEKLLWHVRIPTTGIELVDPWYPPCYPYVPHFFSLWDLAPQQGHGVHVVDINTGVAAFSLKDNPLVRKHRDLFMSVTFERSYNMVSQRGYDPIKQLADQLKPYLKTYLFSEPYITQLAHHIPFWVLEYQQHKTTTRLENYLKNYGTDEVVTVDGTLTTKGHEALYAFTEGNFGIKTQAEFFSIGQLIHPRSSLAPQTIIESLLPLTPLSSSHTLSTFLSHGSHTFGLIGARPHEDPDPYRPVSAERGIVGIAPRAQVTMIKAFNETTMASTKSTIIAALQKALEYKADVVNLSLKVSDVPDTTASSWSLFQELIDRLPYVVAASGNNGDPHFAHYAGKTMGYPARFASVPFSVGAFGYDEGHAFIPSFSQYEKNRGPKFVAPGVAILSAGILADQQEDSAYLFLDGTSMASSIIAGFVALMLAEFRHDFSREQLLLVCYRSGFHLVDTHGWRERVVFGALDMRTALFILHVLKRIKNSNLVEDFDAKFNNLALAVYTLLIEPVDSWSALYLNHRSFKNDMLTYIKHAQHISCNSSNNNSSLSQLHDTYHKNFYVPASDKLHSSATRQEALQEALAQVTNSVVYTLTLDSRNVARPAYVSDATLHTVHTIINASRVELFDDSAPEVRIHLPGYS